MKFDRLRLNGFKSFVDQTELVIRDGLTGIVGPNGCGKSNLLEAMRWVMGESRAKAMRGAGMDDVIFAGSAHRPARAFAEVTLTIDNLDRLAPASVNDTDTLDIVRRITRDAGSAYRINGKEARARDVQMLFADASTGAQSPALVRQGQIAELISAKPKSRRRILEEAAGISGLYQRRHEAELRLNAAEANLTRVDDTLDQISTQAASLARQARTAARYRELGAALREAEGRLLYLRWAEADEASRILAEALSTAIAATTRAEAAARAASTARENAEAALPTLRDEDHLAATLLSRATLEREAIDAAEAQARAAIDELRSRIAQLDKDLEREDLLNRDAGEVMARLDAERSGLAQAQDGHEARLTAAKREADDANAALRALELKLDELGDESARLAARHQSAERLVNDLDAMKTRAERAQAEAETHVTAARRAGDEAQAALATAQTAHEAAQRDTDMAGQSVTAAEAERSRVEATESESRQARATAEGEAGALAAEKSALEKLVARGRKGGQAALDHITVAKGYEAALGAALGEDLHAALADDAAASGWHDLPALTAAPLPQGAAPLAPHVTAPPALTRRLAHIGVVESDETARALFAQLAPGQCIVTRAGGLWRWDGMAGAAGEASSAAALHLQKVNQLKDISQAEAEARARAQERIAAHNAARAALDAATSAERNARQAAREAERALSDAARAATRAESALSLAASRVEAAQAEWTRHRDDAADAARRLAEARRSLADLPDRAAAAQAVEHARTGVEAARMATMSRRAAHDELQREGQSRAKRLAEIDKERSRWAQRLEQASTRSAELKARRDESATALTQAEARPAELAQRRTTLAEDETRAKTRLEAAQTALRTAETAAQNAAQAERDAERGAADHRAASASAEARAEAAKDAAAAARLRIHEALETTPEDLAQALPESAPQPADALETHIARLRAQRDSLGAVNLRADEDKLELETERDRLAAEKTDLEQAIAKLRAGIGTLNRDGRERLLAAFETVNTSFATLFSSLFGGGEARLELVESDDPLDAGLEIMCQPPGKKLSTLSLLSGGEQTLTAMALIFAVFLANPAPICVLDEVDAPLDDANVSRFCDLLDEMTKRTQTRFLIITHHGVTMARMDRLYGVTMVEQGVSQLVSVDLAKAEALVA